MLVLWLRQRRTKDASAVDAGCAAGLGVLTVCYAAVALNWCAYALMTLPAPYGWAGLMSPVIMLFFILKLTGIPPTEEQALASRGEDYREYQSTTSAFVPWFPKRRPS